MIRVGLVGYGLAGRVFHAPMITAVEGLELAAVVERSTRNAVELYPDIATYGSLTAMLEDKTLELIVIATPSPTHAALAIEALRAGRHVVVDKPFGATSGEIREMMACAKTAGKLLIPFHNRRWDSDFQTLEKVIGEERLGRIVSFESTFDRWRPAPKLGVWREDGSFAGGTLLDLGTHLGDQALKLFGLPLGVSAEVLIERSEARAPDSFTVRLRYPGVQVMFAGNCLAAMPRARFLVRGTEGNFVKWGLDPQEEKLKKNPRVIDPGWGKEPASAWPRIVGGEEGGVATHPIEPIPGDYRLCYAGVRDALLGEGEAPVRAVDAWRVARILEWAVESSETHREIACDWSDEPE